MTMSLHHRIGTLAILVAVAALVGCRGSEQSATAQRAVTIYVSTDRVFSEPVLREYEKRTGVRVNAVYDTEETKSTGLANRLIAEQARPQADVFWSNKPVRTLVLKSRGVLTPYRSPSAEGIPSALIDPEGYLTGFSARIRVIAYNTKLVKPEEAPRSIFDLADPKWRGQVAMAIRDSVRPRSTSRRCMPWPATRRWTISFAGSRRTA
jgi:iron(III) transport system substrate-binding protein